MSRNDNYGNSRRRNHRKSERDYQRNSHERETHDSKNSRDKKANFSKKNRGVVENSTKREFQREIAKILQKDAAETELAIRAFREQDRVCAVCGKSISMEEMGSAFSCQSSEELVHFDCVLKQISENENISSNEKISYIGQGRFAVLYFENPHDLRHFSIRKTIEFEKSEERLGWRDEMAGLFSQIK